MSIGGKAQAARGVADNQVVTPTTPPPPPGTKLVHVGRQPIFNATGELILPSGPENVVLEVLETITVDDEVVAGVAALVAAGYRIAIDDFVPGSGHERLLTL
jgi:c-di-GMP-related signal transduction protein